MGVSGSLYIVSSVKQSPRRDENEKEISKNQKRKKPESQKEGEATVGFNYDGKDMIDLQEGVCV